MNFILKENSVPRNVFTRIYVFVPNVLEVKVK